MIKLKSDLERPPRKRSRRLLLLLVLGVAAATVLFERWRGQWCLKTWKNAQTAKGECFDANGVWPRPSAQSREFSNALAHAIAKPLGRLGSYTPEIRGIVPDGSGQWRRGSQETLPPSPLAGSTSNSWQDLGELLEQSEPTLQSLRALMKHPAAAMDYAAEEALARERFPNFIGVRVSAQMLHAAVINDLHNGNLKAAQQNLDALLAFAKLYEKDPTLVNYMIRIAILGLTVDACWDGLEAEGWTESQLAAIQQACPDIDRLLSQMPRCLEAERVSRIYMYRSFRSQSYDAWVRHYEPVLISLGWKPPAADTAPLVRFERQWFFHPLWSVAWADQEELSYLRHVQTEITILREAAQQRSWRWLKRQLAANRADFRLPAASWRFYQMLPLVDWVGDSSDKEEPAGSTDPYPNFSRAWECSMKNLALMELVKTDLALKRFKLKHGEAPSGLADLVPEFLAAVPIDLMDGQPLRYRLNPDNSFTLYSVGDDGKDDGGQIQIVTAPAPAPEAKPAPVAKSDASTASADPGPAVQPGAIISIIVMDDAELTDAIRNLARMAGLNYMLDPRIGFGQVGSGGKIVAEPTVSFRWENITAEQALTALLNNYNLQLVEDPKSKIARVTVRDPAASNAKPNPPWTGKDWVWQTCAKNVGKSQVSPTAVGSHRE